ncbi:MAG: metallophosphoesterase [Neisseriales bacterium]|nr:MAG: metallophosphoesterase [Neisseriales bacterium]
MKIVCLSDTHSKHQNFEEKLPAEADVIIHAGDITRIGSVQGIQVFLNWYAELPYKYKIFIAGNHDFALQEEKNLIRFPDNVIYLENSSVTIEEIKIWGSPVCAIDEDWAFNFNDLERRMIYNKIPTDTNIIVSHNPPYGIMDKVSMINRRKGCKILRDKIKEINPKYVIFGHIHEGAGTQVTKTTTYINTACHVNVFEY